VEYGRRLLDAVHWNGLAMVEFKYDVRDGLPKILEVNPRMWGSAPLAINCGIDFPYCLYKMAVEGDIEPQHTYPVGVKMRFFYEDLAASVSHFIKGGANRTLFYHFLRDLLDFRIRDGIFQLDDLKPAWTNTLKALSRAMRN
jgi:predicted ATP-grasp superfamily ATP-dependent carboligase